MKVASEKRYKKVAAFFAALLLFAFAFAGCSHDRNEPEPAPGKDDCITLTLTVPFSINSRADNQGHEEVDSTFPTFEDFINPNDIGIFVFLGEEENAPLVGKWTLLAESKDPNTGMTGYGSHYVITLKMTRDDLYKVNPDINIGPNSSDEVKFRVVILANQKTSKTDTNTYSSYNKYQTYKALIDEASTEKIRLNTEFYPPDGNLTSTIPMFGMCLFKIKADDLYYTRPDEIIDLGTIYMLRSLVKVRLVDNTVKDAYGYPKIFCSGNSKDGLCYTYKYAYYLPANAIDYQNGVQVDNINVLNLTQMNPGYVGNIKNVGKEVYASYCPEQQVKSYNGKKYPLFTFSYQKTQGSALRDSTINLEGTKLPDNTHGLIRNHIYTVEVTNEPVVTRSGQTDNLCVKVSDSTW